MLQASASFTHSLELRAKICSEMVSGCGKRITPTVRSPHFPMYMSQSCLQRHFQLDALFDLALHFRTFPVLDLVGIVFWKEHAARCCFHAKDLDLGQVKSSSTFRS